MIINVKDRATFGAGRCRLWPGVVTWRRLRVKYSPGLTQDHGVLEVNLPKR